METTKKPKRKPLTKEQLQDTARLKKIWDEKAPQLALTQAKAAKKFDFANQSAVNQYLNGRIPLNMKRAAEFAKLLKVDPSEICPNMNWPHNEPKAAFIFVTDCAKLELKIAVNDSLAPVVIEGDMMVVDSSYASHDGITTPMGRIIAIFRSTESKKNPPFQYSNEANVYAGPIKQRTTTLNKPIEEAVKSKSIGKGNVKEILDVDAAADFLGVSTETVRILARDKKIPAAKIGRQWRFVLKDLRSYLQGKYQQE